jgi:hypothetical protein
MFYSSSVRGVENKNETADDEMRGRWNQYDDAALVKDDDVMTAFPGYLWKDWGTPLPWLHLILVFILTGLFASASSLSAADGWLFSPTRCSLWVDGTCVPQSAADSVLTLRDEMLEYESRTSGLFSAVHAPFLVLAAQVLCCALSLKVSLMSSSDSTIQITKHLSILLLVAYGSLFLFMRTAWLIPLNNLFLVELIYVLAVLFIGTYSLRSAEHAGLVVHVVSALLTYPFLAVAALAAAGEDDTVAHLTIFFSLGLASFAFLALAIEFDSSRLAGFLSIFWLCMVPFVVRCCVRLRDISEWSHYFAAWGTASLVLVLVLYLLVAVFLTLASQQIWPFREPTPTLLIFQYLDLAVKTSLGLLILIGYF